MGGSFESLGIPENDIQPAAGRYPATGRTISMLCMDDICVLRTQTMKPRNLFGFGASFTLAAIYSRGTCRPTRRPTAVRAARQTAPAVCPAGANRRGAAVSQPEKMVGGRPATTKRCSPENGKPRRTLVLRGSLTLAAIYSRGTCRPTTIDVLMFHFRVRNGTGWDHQAMTTRFQIHSLARSSLRLIRNL